jgi:hypothetical protein
MKEEPRRLRVEAVPAAQMPEVLRVAAELYAREPSEPVRADQRHLVEAAAEIGLPLEYLERAAAIVVEREAGREAGREAARRRWASRRRRLRAALSALGVAIGVTLAARLHPIGGEAVPPAPPPAATASVSTDTALLGPCTEIDLSRHVTHRLEESMLSHEGNHLGTLLAGLQEGGVTHRILHGVPFRLDGVVLVGPGESSNGDQSVVSMPAQVEGIAIDRTVKRLHFLHGTHWRARDGTKIGAYIVHYADGTRLEIPIRYGEDVRDWWVVADRNPEVSRARIAWTGSNEASARSGGIRLYLRSWENPYPERPIASLDMVTGEQAAGRSAPSPFLVGLTAEQASPEAATVLALPRAGTE